MMRQIKHIMGWMIAALCLSSAPVFSEDHYVTIFKQDFGGEDPTLPNICWPQPFSDDEKGAALQYFDMPGMAPSCCVVKSSNDNGTNWHHGSDHTYPGDVARGYYLRVDPEDYSGDYPIYRKKLEGICDGVTLRFSAWFANLQQNNSNSSNSPKPKLAVGIFSDKDAKNCLGAGTSASAYKDIELPLCDAANNSSSDLPWKQQELEFAMPAGTSSAYFIVTAQNPTTNGFDFAVDDIEVAVKQPKVTISHTPFLYQDKVFFSAKFENNGFFTDLNSVSYRWEFSSDGGATYSQVGVGNYSGDNECKMAIPSFDMAQHNGIYRVSIGITDGVGEYSPICTLRDSIVVNEKANKLKVILCDGEPKEVQGVTLDPAVVTDGVPVSTANPNIVLVPYVIKFKTTKLDDETICVGSTYDGVLYDKEEVIPHKDIISKDENGCPTEVTLWNLKVTGPTVVVHNLRNVCQGFKLNGETLNDVTNGVDTVVQSDGCITNKHPVKVFPVYGSKSAPLIHETVICVGSTYNGKTFNTPGSFDEDFKLTTVATKGICDCDSFVRVRITVTNRIEADNYIVTCEGEPIVIDGQTYNNAAGDYVIDEYGTSLETGCDSITHHHLSVKRAWNNKANPIDTIICYDSYLWGELFPESMAGNKYLRRDPITYTTTTGCDSIVYYNVEVLKIRLRLEVSKDNNNVCQGSEVEIRITDLDPADVPLTWTPDLPGSARRRNFTAMQDVVCVVKARNDAANCETTDTSYIYVKPSPTLTLDTVNQKESMVAYTVVGGEPPYSIMLDKYEVSMQPQDEIHNVIIGGHVLKVFDMNDCSDSKSFEISPVPIEPSGFFTPNGDGVNDRWVIENIDVYPRARVQIFNRDGRLLAEYDSYENETGWDGTYNGHPMPSTDYWYLINLPEADIQYVGHFTLIR